MCYETLWRKISHVIRPPFIMIHYTKFSAGENVFLCNLKLAGVWLVVINHHTNTCTSFIHLWNLYMQKKKRKRTDKVWLLLVTLLETWSEFYNRIRANVHALRQLIQRRSSSDRPVVSPCHHLAWSRNHFVQKLNSYKYTRELKLTRRFFFPFSIFHLHFSISASNYFYSLVFFYWWIWD